MKKRGFTLVELLVVIAIVGLLASLAIVYLNENRLKSECESGDKEACEELGEKGKVDVTVITDCGNEENICRVDCMEICSTDFYLENCFERCSIKVEECKLSN